MSKPNAFQRRATAACAAVLVMLVVAGAGSEQTPTQPTLPPQVPTPAPTTPAQNQFQTLSLPAPHFPTGPGQTKKFVFESVFNYERFEYQPAVIIQRVIRDKASYATPEQAMISHFSAMLEGDFDWWLSGWAQASQELIKTQGAAQKRTPDDWRAAWAKALKGEQALLTERIETGPAGPYVMLVYSLRDKAGQETFRSTYVTKFEAGRWVATQDLANDPLFHHYESGRDRVSITVR